VLLRGLEFLHVKLRFHLSYDVGVQLDKGKQLVCSFVFKKFPSLRLGNGRLLYFMIDHHSKGAGARVMTQNKSFSHHFTIISIFEG
jgi:hypothetical protein